MTYSKIVIFIVNERPSTQRSGRGVEVTMGAAPCKERNKIK
jgi:hypothetical protein